MKRITFYTDGAYDGVVTTYDETVGLIKNKVEDIRTTQVACMSFDLLDLGYDIYLSRKGKIAKIEPGPLPYPEGKELRRGHNILKLFTGHVFDPLFEDESEFNGV
jgi:hypothetical protein